MSDESTRSDPGTASGELEMTTSAALGQSRLRSLIPERTNPAPAPERRLALVARPDANADGQDLATRRRNVIVAAAVATARVRILARPTPAPVAEPPLRVPEYPLLVAALPSDSSSLDRAALAEAVARSVRDAQAVVAEAVPAAPMSAPPLGGRDDPSDRAARPPNSPSLDHAAIAEAVARSVRDVQAVIAGALPDEPVVAFVESRGSRLPAGPPTPSAPVSTPGPRQIEAALSAVAAMRAAGALDARQGPVEFVRTAALEPPPAPERPRPASANARIAELAAALERVVPPSSNVSTPQQPSRLSPANAAPPLVTFPQLRAAPPPPPVVVAATGPPDLASAPPPRAMPAPALLPAPLVPPAKPTGGGLPPSAVRIGRAQSNRPPTLVTAALVTAAPVTVAPALVPGDTPGPRGAAAWAAIQASVRSHAQSQTRTFPLPEPPPLPEPAASPARTTGGFVRGAAGVARRGASIALRIAILAAMAAGIGWSSALLAYRFTDPPASTLMLAQQFTGRPISQRQVTLDRISPNLIRAVIASEDGNFCRHRGVDWGAIREAVGKATEDGGRLRGASTISMQTVKNLMLWPQGHIVRKGLELPLAYLADLAWGKRRVLELYLNIAEWGPGIFGAEAAAQHHFRKSAAQLTPREAALLAVSLPNPIERNASRPGPGTQRLARLIETRSARPTLAVSCLGPLR